MPTPLLKAHDLQLVAGEKEKLLAAYGDFIYIDAAATGFLLSLDRINYIPVREGRLIQTKEVFDAVYVKAAASNVQAVIITGTGGVTAYASYGGGGGGGGGGTNILTPYDSYAALGNVQTEYISTGVYVVVIQGSPATAETFQLRAWAGGTPTTDFANGIIVPADYSEANKRVWLRV